MAQSFAGETGHVRETTLTLTKPFELSPSLSAKFTTHHGRRAIQHWQHQKAMDPFIQLRTLISQAAKKSSWNEVTVEDIHMVRDRLIKAGYDGIILHDTAMDAGTSLIGQPMPVATMYVVFDDDVANGQP